MTVSNNSRCQVGGGIDRLFNLTNLDMARGPILAKNISIMEIGKLMP